MLLFAHTPCMSGCPSGVRGTVHPAALFADWPARDTLITIDEARYDSFAHARFSRVLPFSVAANTGCGF